VMNTWLYDLNLVFRPWISGNDNGWRTSVYAFVGGGGGPSRCAWCRTAR